VKPSTVRRIGAVTLATGLALSATGCGPSFNDLPLPGTTVDGDAIRVSATFDEALNLTSGATVKVNGISVGKVQDVTTEDFQAIVQMDVEADAGLRQNATARLRYNTPLGELFVDVTNPRRGPEMPDDGEIRQTDTAPTVEDALASASMLINGGGLSQLEQVTNELNTALGGREGEVRKLFRQLNTFLRNANGSTGDIDRALKAMNQVSQVLSAREETINRAVKDFRPAARVLRENTDEFVTMLTSLEKFTGSANALARESKDDLIRILKQVDPILAELHSLSGDFGSGLNTMTTAAKQLDKTVVGDFLNLNAVMVMTRVGPISLPGGGGGGGGGGTGGGSDSPLDPVTDPLQDVTDPLLGGDDGGLLGEGGLLGAPRMNTTEGN
jgi:phospholipid/cholesterol/gamma-HCH transport system substrate-binding protein